MIPLTYPPAIHVSQSTAFPHRSPRAQTEKNPSRITDYSAPQHLSWVVFFAIAALVWFGYP